ncbi:UNKNOWN [Stylonychia lemnae]|uniref:Uncharacterized protein n=1 Tax=Stylonychia lemnae TaxID=5949 RepID=A0A078BBJ3_STYLE|nr:UNKNOWN [Stylonychia lemnae]|eukprot:CDW91769.1 UNKNOWN [Stylonychia lemnae]
MTNQEKNQTDNQNEQKQQQNIIQGFQDLNGMSMIQFDKNNETSNNINQSSVNIMTKDQEQFEDNPIKLDQIGLDIDLSNINYEKNNESILIVTQGEIKFEQSQSKIKRQMIDNPIIENGNTWQKVSFTKRRSANNVTNNGAESNKAKATNNNISSIQSRIIQKQQSNPTQIIDYDEKNMSQFKSSQLQQHDLKRKKSLKVRQPGEILPVFDCLFCCQEHFVLNKINERTLIVKYANHPLRYEIQRDKLMLNMLLKQKEVSILNHLVVKNIEQEFQQIENIQQQIEQLEEKRRRKESKIQNAETSKGILASITQNIVSKPIVIKLAQVTKQIKQLNEKKLEQIGKEAIISTAIKHKSNDIDKDQRNFFGGLSCADNDTESQHFSKDIEESESSLEEYSEEEQEEEEYDDEDDASEEIEEEGEDDETSKNEEDQEHIDIEEEDEELKEIVQEYNRKEEELKKSPQLSKQVHYVSNEGNNDSQNNICGISSIDQQIDEEDFAGSDEDNPTPLTNNINFNNPTSFTNITGGEPIQSYNLNIQENPISRDEDDEGNEDFDDEEDEDEDEDSERYTFGETSLSPVRALGSTLIGQAQLSKIELQYQLQKVNDEYFEQQSISQGSHQKNAMLLDISPVSCNRVQRVPNYMMDGTVISKDIDQYMNIQQNDHDMGSIRAKIEFYPSQEVDSLDIHITSVPTLQQQRSFDDSSNFITQQHFPQKSQVHFEDDSEEFSNKFPFQKQLQYSYEQKSNEYDTNPVDQSKLQSQIKFQCQTNTNQNDQIDKRLQIIQEKQQQSKSFTTNTYKTNHQKLIPMQQFNKFQGQTNQITPTSNKNDQGAIRDANYHLQSQFFTKQEKEQIQEFIKNKKFPLKKSKQVVANSQNSKINNHLGSFDSIKQKRVDSQIAQRTGSQIDNNQCDIIQVEATKQSIYKQKTQALCTPIDTNDNILLQYGINGAQSKTNKTTVNQNTRRQNSTSNGNMFLVQNQNGTTSQSNILFVGENMPMTGQLLTNRKHNEQFFSIKVPASEKPQNGKKQFQRITEKNYMQYSEQIVRNQQQSLQVNKNSSMKTVNPTQSPSVLKQSQRILNTNGQSMNDAMSHMSVNQLSKKDIDHFLKSALCSSRYQTTSNNQSHFNNLFKQSIDMTNYDKMSKSNGKKKRKSKVSLSKNNHTNSISDNKKIIKAKKSTKKIKQPKNFLNQQEYYQQKQQQHQDMQNYANICNSMNFSNDYSIPSILSNGGLQQPINQKSSSMNSGQIDHKSSQKQLMYQSIQDAQNMLHNINYCNNTNIQDTSNNFPYSGSLQAEMSTTCISNGCNSNQMIQNGNTNQINLSNIQTNQFNQHLIQQNSMNQSSTTNKKGYRKQQQLQQLQHINNNMQMNKDQLQKMNSSIEEMTLFNLLSSMNIKKQPKQIKNDNKIIHKNAKLSQRGSISVQRSQNFNGYSSIEKSIANKNTDPSIDPKHQTTNILVNNMNQIIPGHHGQFSFSQNNVKLNQTTNLNKTTTGAHRKRMSKGGSGTTNGNTFNNVNIQINTTSSSSTLKNTSVQAQRRDNVQRTRSTSKSNHNIKTDLPTHQLLLTNQVAVSQQVLLKNKQILFQSNIQPPSLNLTNGGIKLSQAKNVTMKRKKVLTTSTDQTNTYHQDLTSQSRQIQNNSRISNKTSYPQQEKGKMNQFTGLTNKNFQELGQLNGTSKILMSTITSPLRPLATNNPLGIGQSLNLGHVNNISLGGVKKDIYHANLKETLEKQK